MDAAERHHEIVGGLEMEGHVVDPVVGGHRVTVGDHHEVGGLAVGDHHEVGDLVVEGRHEIVGDHHDVGDLVVGGHHESVGDHYVVEVLVADVAVHLAVDVVRGLREIAGDHAADVEVHRVHDFERDHPEVEQGCEAVVGVEGDPRHHDFVGDRHACVVDAA